MKQQALIDRLYAIRDHMKKFKKQPIICLSPPDFAEFQADVKDFYDEPFASEITKIELPTGQIALLVCDQSIDVGIMKITERRLEE